ncbi:glycosyltransferase [Flammeovirga agarivorans]|uniref:Glycosyltransferase family 4 protein n=1 Tax=Flammeovirga agarivorans TaxID=2726742 RepID=A0A7X8XY66_9BACT|nr:glycosyltransferase [Flammeovirga agarivorans]NLR93934.1 glycosyltransferase family 4 protein [Flammeovirga agarivorans]
MPNSILFILETPLNQKSIKANLIQTLQMCKAYRDNNYDVTLLMPTTHSNEKSEEVINNIMPDAKGVKYIFSEFNSKFKFSQSLDRFTSLKKSISFTYDYYYTRSYFISQYIMRKGGQLIYESHNAYFTKHKFFNKLMTSHMKKLMKKDNFKLFVTISDSLKNYWVDQTLNSSQIVALHDGAEPISDNIVVPEHLTSFFEEIGDRKIVLYAGSLYADRKVDRVIELARRSPEAYFVVVGGNPKEVEGLKAQAKGVENVKFLGKIEHKYISYMLTKADILLAIWSYDVPTMNYCSPLKVFEYMSAGKLIVAEGYLPILEVLKDQENALIAQPEDIDHLSSAIQSAIDNPQLMEIGVNNPALLEKKYTWDVRVKEIIKTLAA